MTPFEEYSEFYEWLILCCQSDEENIHELKLTTQQCRNLQDFLSENCR